VDLGRDLHRGERAVGQEGLDALARERGGDAELLDERLRRVGAVEDALTVEEERLDVLRVSLAVRRPRLEVEADARRRLDDRGAGLERRDGVRTPEMGFELEAAFVLGAGGASGTSRIPETWSKWRWVKKTPAIGPWARCAAIQVAVSVRRVIRSRFMNEATKSPIAASVGASKIARSTPVSTR